MPAGVDFKAIQVVPTASDFLDIILSKTQRKTPTVIHKGYSITRIRSFYIRKVRFAQDAFEERLGAICSEFPRLEDIHPFYADLMNVLYDRDHYKLALGQLNTAKHLVGRVGQEYQRLVKYGDSLFRCKQLKKAALGRMATIVRRQKDALTYLEQVRQHLTRLPSIDPSTRTLILCGFPNVGKSSFMKKVTKANVDVQPYAFTTKSLFVGHMDYEYLRWQVIDTPGVLDHPLEDRNTIEMQSITAMAHIRASIMYFMDVSEECGYGVQEQVSLLRSLKPLFAGKPLILVMNKADLADFSTLQASDERHAALNALIEELKEEGMFSVAKVSCRTEEGVMEARNTACDMLLALRSTSPAVTAGKTSLMGRLRVTQPKPRDDIARPATIPPAILAKRMQKVQEQQDDPESMPARRYLAKDREAMEGGAGVYNVDLRASYLVADDSWKYDPIPEIMDGKNIADFLDPDIEARLCALEAEEEEVWVRGGKYEEPILTDAHIEARQEAAQVKAVKKMALLKHHGRTDTNSRIVHPERITKRQNTKKTSSSLDDDRDQMDVDKPQSAKKRPSMVTIKKATTSRFGRIDRSQIRSSVKSPTSQAADTGAVDRSVAGIRPQDLKKIRAGKIAVDRKRTGFRGEADRAVSASKPKHLYSGKRSMGTADRR